MFIGHFGMGFGAKAAARRASLGTLFLSAQFLDLLWPSLLLLGVEQVRISPGITAVTPLDFVHYPVSHGLLAVVLWATLLAVVYQLVRRYSTGAVVVWFLVVSHWVLDFITHRPDLPLYPGSRLVGLDLWASMPATVVVESLLFGIGLWLYARERPSPWTGSAGSRYGVWRFCWSAPTRRTSRARRRPARTR